ncbi:phosphoglycerate mutase [Emiliania huxleyi virus 84]|nr:phosphoglycerate mutase [Emiliania huxleyi virus 84]AEP14958.1 phosphoglycerate mutase [Emiliania huxleyi virus 88]
MIVRFIRHGQSMCNLYHNTGEGSEDVCTGPGGGNSHLSEMGIQQANDLNASMISGNCFRIYESDNNGEILYSIEAGTPFIKFDVKTHRGIEKLHMTTDTKILVSTMNRAMETATHAFNGFGNCKFEYTPLLEEVVRGDNYDKRYKDYLKLARQIKKMGNSDIRSVIMVCHHNTIRYMICALAKVYGTRYPNIHFNTINASYIDMEFSGHPLLREYTYCVVDKGELRHIPQTTKSMTTYDAKNLLMVGGSFQFGYTTEYILSTEEGRTVVYAVDENRPDLQTSLSDVKFVKSQLPKLSVSFVLDDEYMVCASSNNSTKKLKDDKIPRELAVAVRLKSGITKILFHSDVYPIHRNYNIPGEIFEVLIWNMNWVVIIVKTDDGSLIAYIPHVKTDVEKLLPADFMIPVYVMIFNGNDDNIEFEAYTLDQTLE